jgi:chemotaxis protein histidine kinase CheA
LTAHRDVLQLSIDEDSEARRSVKIEELALKRLYNAAVECHVDPDILSMIEGLTERPFSQVLAWLDNAWQKTLAGDGKEGDPIIWSGDVRLSREPYRQLFQSFIHIVRNSVDHGIETPDERLQRGKSERGNLCVSARRDGDFYFITFKDDGRGIDPQRVLEIARNAGVPIPETISRDEILMLLATPGLSSKHNVSELSGCGLGLDIVRHEARRLGGDISIQSELGQGTEICVWFKHSSEMF